MSKVKQLLPDDYTLDYETLEPVYMPEPDEIPLEYMAMNDIDRAIAQLKTCLIAPRDADELRRQAEELKQLANHAEQPF